MSFVIELLIGLALHSVEGLPVTQMGQNKIAQLQGSKKTKLISRFA